MTIEIGELPHIISIENMRVIRPFQPSDEAATVDVWYRAGKAAYPFLPSWQTLEIATAAEIFRKYILDKNQIWVGAEDKKIFAFIAMQGTLIDRLYVNAGEWRKGWGAQLLDLAKELSPRGLELYTHVENRIGRRFYEKHGFVAVKFGVSPPPESAPDVEYHWRP